jgi:hypothetical protein
MKFGDIIQNAQSVLRPDAHVVIVSRDISLTSSLAITGVGFAPSSVICFRIKVFDRHNIFHWRRIEK